MSAGRQSRHFSMIRDFQLADLATLANGFAGMGSVFASIHHVGGGGARSLWIAILLLPLALIFDVADGRIARWRRAVSPLGAELDSLADLVSFGVAPAVLAYALGMRGGWDVAILIYFVGCGISRLARYNVTSSSLAGPEGKVRHFEGTPIPSSLILVVLLAVLVAQGRVGDELWLGSLRLGFWTWHPLSAIFALSGSAMISKTLHIPKP